MLLRAAMPFDAIAARDTKLILLSRDRWIAALSSHPSICLRWITSIARRLDDDRRRLVILTTRPLIAQLAYVTLDHAESVPHGKLVLRPSQTTLVHLVGARRRSVTCGVAELRE
ncbi:MAG: hypothetical protein NVS3B26_13930 [Mycobacteriales bacterium]